jgi:hypothetical protein
MQKIICIPFEYNDKEHYTLIRLRPAKDEVELHVTIMNGELQNQLYGQHVFKYRIGNSTIEMDGDIDGNHLKSRVARAINEYIRLRPILTN